MEKNTTYIIVAVVLILVIAALAYVSSLAGFVLPDDIEAECIDGVCVNPSTKYVNNGETFKLDVEVAGISDLYGFQFDVVYDKNILEFRGASQGTFLNRNGQDQTYRMPYNNETAGLVENIVCVRLGSIGSVDGEGILETIRFKAIGTGTSPITLSNVKLANIEASKIDSSVSNGEVVVY